MNARRRRCPLPLLLLLALLAQGACRSDTAASAPPVARPEASHHYAHLFGQRYRTRVDLYLFTFADEDDRRYVGLNDGRLRTEPSVLPRAVTRDHVGHTYGPFKILDVVPSGSELTLVAETHEVTAASGIREKEGYPMGFICRLAYGGRQLDAVYAEFIQAGEHAPFRTPNQRLDEKIAMRVEG